ncbi:GumC family protein [Belliella kenyensis]|uniref:non-specific protein-tyrosine kinase n=1 Tax=Belliella kenyensis TaxID=1472724 RepID=A0ABV8EP49_9BACT|nr:polysaccharide biosynthesis tyrosine autokinase [Belliella kenyensis]MCH7400530.1 polysaccharide biosynthesis tyrosine autokinase [Belliella kenyensis]MDN3604454.1 polysaccharide biosynthesis tyrosine autokinase [Belliella kenyensis]
MNTNSSPFLKDQLSTEISLNEISDFKEKIQDLLASWKLYSVGIFLGLLLAFFYIKSSPDIYQIESAVLIGEEMPSLGMDLFEPMKFMQSKSNVENEISILKSYPLLEKTLNSMNLNVSYYEKGLFTYNQIFEHFPIEIFVDWTHPQLIGGMFSLEFIGHERFRIHVIDTPHALYIPEDPKHLVKWENLSDLAILEGTFGLPFVYEFMKLQVNNVSFFPGQTVFFKIQDSQSLIMEFKEQTNIKTVNKLSSVINLTFQSTSKKLGEHYLNLLMENYLDKELNEKNRAAEKTIQFIDRQLAVITDSLSFFEDKLQQFRSQNRVFNLSQEGTMIYQKYLELEKQKSSIELSLTYYNDLLNYLAIDEYDQVISPSAVGLEDPILNAMINNIVELQSQKTTLKGYYSPNSPAIREINTQLEAAKNQIAENIRSAIKNTKSSLLEINQKIVEVDADINTLPQTEKQLVGLQRQFNINENIYLYLLQKRAESEISKASSMSKNMILEYARSLDKPIAPKKAKNLAIGAFLGFLIPFMFVVSRSYFSYTIKDPKFIEKNSTVPLLRTIGRSNTEGSLAVQDNPKSLIAESFRILRSDMAFLKPNYKKLSILMTSASPGEGKTFCAINLASVFALLGKKTIVVDLDLRRPKLAKHFGISNSQGVSTCLSKHIPWEDFVQKSSVPNLHVLCSGPIPPNPSELIDQEDFKIMIDQIKESYDILILDSPPIGIVSETLTLTTLVDINLFVLRQNVSEKGNVHLLNEIVAKNPNQKFYAILNDTDHSWSRRTYGYSYNYSAYESYGFDSVPRSFWDRLLRKK